MSGDARTPLPNKDAIFTSQLKRLTLAVLSGLLCSLLTAKAYAAGDPKLQWWTLETAHFRFHYEKNLEPVAEHLARLSEAIHQRLVGPMGYRPQQRTEVALTDYTDSANGLATALPYNTIRLYVTAPDDLSPLGDYDDWYLELMTHEYTHILHTDNISGVPAVINKVLGKTLAPNQSQPRWILEGLAVVAESRFTSGGRIRGTLFDMFLRADVLGNNIARLDQISSSPRRWPQGTLWYLYGSKFMQWIVDVYGADTMRSVATDYGASLAPWAINRAIRRATGRTYVQLYQGFIDHIQRRYARQLKGVKRRGLREGQRITYHGRTVAYPQFMTGSSEYELLYFRDDKNTRRGHYRLKLDPNDQQARGEKTLVARTTSQSPIAASPDGKLWFSSVVPFRRIYQRHDLFHLPAGKTAPRGGESYRKRLTRGQRATAPTVSPDGQHLVFTVNHRGTTTLKIADIRADGSLDNIRTLVPNAPFEQAYTPRFSPRGDQLVYSAWSSGGYRDIRLVDLKTGLTQDLTHDRALDTGPCWSTDGTKIYFSSDRTGIFNIYQLDLESRRLRQVTNVRTGALMPTVSRDEGMLVYVGYTAKGYDLFAMPLDASRFLKVDASAVTSRPQAQSAPPDVAMHKRRFNPAPTLRPHNYFFEYAPGNYGSNALTISTSGSDIAGHHSFGAVLTADPAAPLPQLSVSYAYGRLPADLSVRVSNRVTPRNDYRFNDERVRYIENSYHVQSAVSYTDLHEFGSHRISLSHTASMFDAELPVGSVGPLDPYASPTIEPQGGLLSIIHAGYYFSNVEGAFDSSGAARGFSLNLGLDMADQAIGSTESVVAGRYAASAYLTMPWPGYHTLALRSSGAMAKGSYARRGIYYVGGYNLENVSLLDTVTSGVFNGAFVLRGYPPGAYSGSSFTLQNAEYRIPLAQPDRGPSTLPVYLRRIDANLFFDYGGAFNDFDEHAIKLLSDGSLIDSTQLHAGGGAELWFGATLGYGLNVQLRLGYAYGFSDEALPGGQWYFLASNAY